MAARARGSQSGIAIERELSEPSFLTDIPWEQQLALLRKCRQEKNEDGRVAPPVKTRPTLDKGHLAKKTTEQQQEDKKKKRKKKTQKKKRSTPSIKATTTT